jgi:putative transposase
LFQPQQPKKLSVSAKIPSDDGLTKESSPASKLQKELDCTTSTSSSKTKCLQRTPSLAKKTSAIAESPLRVKKMTSKGKSNSCTKSSQRTKLSLTLDQVSTSKGKVFDPSLNWLPKEESEKLWLPTEIGCADLHSNWWSGSFKSIKSNSWFSVKRWTPLKKRRWSRTSSQSSMFSIAESMEGENTNELKQRTSKIRKSAKLVANKSLRVGLRPTPEVANTLKRWFGSVRYTYNWALECIKAKPKEYKINMIWLRKRFINFCNIPKDKKFLLDTPKSIRDNAVSDLQDAFKSNFAIKKKKPSHTFDIKFRKKKDAQAITITSEQIKHWDTAKTEFTMFPTFLKNKIKFHVKKNKSIPSNISYDCKLLMSKLGKFSLMIVFHDPPCENQTGSTKSCSIDPGVRTALTIYSPEAGICYKIGDGDISRIYRLCLWLDKLISSNQKKKTRGKALAILRLRERIRNLITEFHCKAVHFILSKFNEIILPTFNVSQMVKRANRKIRSKTVRQMLCWRHYGFKQRLLNAAKFCNAKVYIRGEEYTSKVCTHCRNIKHNLGGAKIYKCLECNLKADRDCCGARNIFIKNMKRP